MAPTIVIGILTWHGYDLTKACLESLKTLSDWPIPTLVVDNGSGTGEGVRLAQEFGPPVESIELAEDGGVPTGYNAAMRWASDRHADYVLLLNNDTIISDPAMIRLLAAAATDRVAAVGPIVRDPDGAVHSAGGFLRMWKARSDHFKEAQTPDRPYSAEWLDGPCLLVSVDAARRIGGLEPTYFLYWEELDWCVRARHAGYQCVVQPLTSITHARSSRDPSAEARYLMLRNQILFMRRNGSFSQNLTSFTWLILARIPKQLVRSVGREGLGTALRAASRGIAWNLALALRRRRWRLPADGPDI